MQEESKKQKMRRLRQAFNDECRRRDDGKCVICCQEAVDVHHITDRHEMPNDGYAKENGISLCSECHLKAESDSSKNGPVGRFSPKMLYKLIGSSKQKAESACNKIG